MSEILISYERSTSRSHAQIVAQALRALGYGVWIDDDLPAHRAYEKVIKEQILAAKAVVVIWSADAAESDWVRSEANQAREARKLVQLTIDNAPLPMPFEQIHCVDMKGWTGDLNSPGWRKVVASVADLVGTPRVVSPQNRQTSKPITRKNSICVLPFVNMSGDAEQEYFSDGISEDIITDLSKVSALFVIARNTAFTFKAKSVDVTQVARQLDISHVLEGSVRKAGGRVRITAQLTDGVTGGHIWAERYDRDLTDIFALQDEISGAIVNALKLKLLPEEKQQIETRGTNSVAAYDLYLRGKRPAFGADQQLAGIALLEAATRIAPDYADAWGALAKMRGFWRFNRLNSQREEIDKKISAEADRALSLDPYNVDAIEAQCNLLPPFGRIAEAEVLIRRMEEIAPNNSDVLRVRAMHLRDVGRYRDAMDAVQRAHTVDPLDDFVSNVRATTLWQTGRYAEARRGFEELLERRPDQYHAAFGLLMVCVQTQDWAAVDALLAPARLAQFPLREYEKGATRFASLMRDPSPESRRRPINAAQRRFEASGVADFFELQLAAESGASDEAHAIALRARFGPAGNPADVIGWAASRPETLFSSMFPEFRRDPRFVQLCARCGLVDYWLTTQKWPDCVDEVAPYYDFKVECERVAAGPPLPPASEFVPPSNP